MTTTGGSAYQSWRVSSQSTGGPSNSQWHLPGEITAVSDGLLRIYIGSAVGEPYTLDAFYGPPNSETDCRYARGYQLPHFCTARATARTMLGGGIYSVKAGNRSSV